MAVELSRTCWYVSICAMMFIAGTAIGVNKSINIGKYIIKIDPHVGLPSRAVTRSSRQKQATPSAKQIVWLEEPQRTDVQVDEASLFRITPCPKQRVAHITYDSGKIVSCKRGFSLSSVPGKLGNTLLGISNMLFVAEHTASKAMFPRHTDSLKLLLGKKVNHTVLLHDFRDDDQRPEEDDVCSRIFISDFFFWNSVFLGVDLSNNTLTDKTRLLRSYLRPHIQIARKPASPGTLVVHIRSGDIMKGNGAHAGYVQPPLAFYQKIILDNNFTSVVVVCEDHDNPTVDALAKWSDIVTFSTGILEDDIATILGASHLVLSYGTFAWTLGLIADAPQQLYVPCMPSCSLTTVCDEIPIAAACYTFPNFTQNGNWHNTAAQRELMLTYPISDIVIERNKLMM